jgi:hypothetical protein
MRFSLDFESDESFEGRGFFVSAEQVVRTGVMAEVDQTKKSAHWMAFAEALASVLEEAVGEG